MILEDKLSKSKRLKKSCQIHLAAFFSFATADVNTAMKAIPTTLMFMVS